MALETREFYTSDELDFATLMGVVDELEPRAFAILNYVSRIANDTDKITVKVRTYQATSTSPIVGFADRTPLSKGFEADEFDAYPFHIKEGWEADVGSKYLMRQGETFGITAEGVVAGVGFLEDRRLELLSSMWHTALNEKVFTWRDQPDPTKPTKKVLSMDFSGEIWDLTDPDTDLDDDDAKVFIEVDAMSEEFFETAGFFPDTAFVNGRSLNTLKGNAEIYKTIRPQATNEPDKSMDVRDAIMISGVNFIALRGKYTTSTGAKAGPVDDGRAIVTNLAKTFEDGYGILRHESAANILNDMDASRAYYSSFEVSKRPPSVALDVYDNGVPVIAHRHGVAHWQMWS